MNVGMDITRSVCKWTLDGCLARQHAALRTHLTLETIMPGMQLQDPHLRPFRVSGLALTCGQQGVLHTQPMHSQSAMLVAAQQQWACP